MSLITFSISLIASLILISCGGTKQDTATPEPPKEDVGQQFTQANSQLDIGSKAPDFKMNDIEGNPFTLSSLKGKVVMIDFWATWCPHVFDPFQKQSQYGMHSKNKTLFYWVFPWTKTSMFGRNMSKNRT